MLVFILSSNVFFGLETYSSLNMIAVLFPKILSSSPKVSVLLTKDSFIICCAIACLLVSLFSIDKKTAAVSDSRDIVVNIADILFNVSSSNKTLKDLNLLAM